ncbi:hypothetical protein [Reichenbachiella ulvae]|uniref:Outer membrane protein beta-barrel domain-containing protein n=1 Tax=Reichenbachiella ulvae TaxID=2980104 RepID=A0ABT3CYM4_9BACT|nr:hypothetical protein [Reichenbachiella ulvae]MCV9388590.1 hypothetical protein [Reichenbachiella ulvae]
MKKIAVLFTFLLLSQHLLAQTDGNYEYTKEFIWGINKNTNGGLIGGFMFRWSSARGEKKFRSIGFELMNVKHPKENRISNGQSQFIYGKSNFLYSIRAQYGFDHLLFKKAPDKGVQINFNYSIGPTLGVIAPYYVQDGNGDSKQFSFEDFPTWNSIARTGHVFEGLGESELAFGVNARAGLLFEMGAFKSNVTGFEIGALIEAFTKEIELMPREDNKAVFLSAYITIFYGSRR